MRLIDADAIDAKIIHCWESALRCAKDALKEEPPNYKVFERFMGQLDGLSSAKAVLDLADTVKL